MNRETSIRTSDTLVVTDRSSRRRWVIIGAVVVLALLVALLVFARSGKTDSAQSADSKDAGQIPTVTVIVPGQSQVGRVVTAAPFVVERVVGLALFWIRNSSGPSVA